MELHYRVRDNTDVIERWTVVRNLGDEPVTLLRADSAAWTLPLLRDYRLGHVTGQWSAESLPTGTDWPTAKRC